MKKKNEFIPLSVPNFSGNEMKYVANAIETEWVSTAGSYILKFEEEIARYVGVQGAVACQSGTAGLHLALKACDIGSGDAVIVPTLTFVAAVNPVKYIGATPIFMDCDDSLTLDVTKLEEFLKIKCTQTKEGVYVNDTNKRIKAIIVVHVFGNMADMEGIMEISQRYQLKVIEDATEALGTYYLTGKYAEKYAGTIGDIGVYSFNGNKIITTGGGGMIVSKQEESLRYCKHLSTQAKTDEIYFDHDEVGYNYRMTNLQAALGLAQLEQLETFIKIKKQNYYKYLQAGIELLEFRKEVRSNYWFYSHWAGDRDGLIRRMADNNIQSRPIWKLIHMLKPYCGEYAYKIEKAIYYYENIVNIPCSSNLGNEIERVIECIKN